MLQMREDNVPGFLLPKETKKGSAKVVLILVILFLISIGGFAWSFNNYRKAKSQAAFLSTPAGQSQITQQEVQALLEKVKKHMLLPEGEPVVATIQDAATLASQQAFYKDAQNEDRLIIYKDKAIIYSPARDLVVNVGPVFIQDGNELRSAAN